MCESLSRGPGGFVDGVDLVLQPDDSSVKPPSAVGRRRESIANDILIEALPDLLAQAHGIIDSLGRGDGCEAQLAHLGGRHDVLGPANAATKIQALKNLHYVRRRDR
ncbi:hypothetical protein HRG_004138 [Hirsutella rhossiliensis]|uniref:Uncharacterized protein n=1 Tax=Hirsutella rhossiliensis TaxID=111463 RepID=A0A9P8N397_9HYPO|nr:uncharacterized protein HRG_04138 [Hirsutella rhossiliensis]KAH0966122.1 hypothetical protein HRG_04138 [Hirsutella rhossiliensis]